MANEHTKTLLLWDILVPSPDIFTLIFCKGNSIFFSYEKNTTQETINILFFGLTYCIVGNISLTLINTLKHVWADMWKGFFVSEDFYIGHLIHQSKQIIVQLTCCRTSCSSRSLNGSSAPGASPGVRVTCHSLSKTLV